MVRARFRPDGAPADRGCCRGPDHCGRPRRPCAQGYRPPAAAIGPMKAWNDRQRGQWSRSSTCSSSTCRGARNIGEIPAPARACRSLAEKALLADLLGLFLVFLVFLGSLSPCPPCSPCSPCCPCVDLSGVSLPSLLSLLVFSVPPCSLWFLFSWWSFRVLLLSLCPCWSCRGVLVLLGFLRRLGAPGRTSRCWCPCPPWCRPSRASPARRSCRCRA